jgi:hypothetical protein
MGEGCGILIRGRNDVEVPRVVIEVSSNLLLEWKELGWWFCCI